MTEGCETKKDEGYEGTQKTNFDTGSQTHTQTHLWAHLSHSSVRLHCFALLFRRVSW